MDDVTAIVIETASRLFRDHIDHHLLAAAEAGTFPQALWDAVEEAGLTLAMIPEEAGGVGLDVEAAGHLVRLAGSHAVPLPLAETMLAGRLVAEAGLELPGGPLSFCAAGGGNDLALVRAGEGWHLSGMARRVPWGRCVSTLALVFEAEGANWLALVPTADAVLAEGTNLALEPRDDLTFDVQLSDAQVVKSPFSPADVKRMGAAVRAIAMAGALERVLELTVAYVGERVQFGRPLSKFQAIQQNMAILAGQVAAAGGAADLAAGALAQPADMVRIASAKIRTGEAAGIAAGIAHQLHGAMGYSFEHMLHFYTKRLWAWRDEFGAEAEWSRVLGAHVLQQGGEGLWPFVTAA